MPSISVTRKHDLPQKKAKAAAEKIAKDLQKRFGLDYAWNGECIEFNRPGVTGTMTVGKDHIKLEADLGWLLTPLKPKIEDEIVAQLDKLAGKRQA